MAATDRSSVRVRSLPTLAAVVRLVLAPRLELRADLIFGGALEVGVVVLGIVGPYMLKILIDGLTDKSLTLALALVAIGLFVLSWAGGTVLSTWRMVYSTQVVDRLTQDLATRALRRQLALFARTREGDSGKLLGLTERLPYALTIVVDGLLWRAIPLALQVAGSLFVTAQVIPLTYTLLLGLVLAAYVAATWLGATTYQSHAARANEAAGASSSDLGDIVRNARRVVLNGAIDVESRLVESRFAAKVHANQRMIWSLVVGSVLQYGLLGAGLFAVLALAARQALAEKLGVSDFVLLQAYAFRLLIPLSGFGFILSQAASAIGTVTEVLDLLPGAEDEDRVVGPVGAAVIRLDQVSFRYPGTAVGLEDVTTSIAAGSFVVIVGPNGSGKSTLAQLIAGVLEPRSGRVEIAGQDIGAVAPAQRHQFVLYVPQMVTLFNRSLRDNALYPPTTQNEAGLLSLLASWRFQDPDQALDMSRIAGEGGERLSGGQLQKLELARIAGVRVPALILDESTSALDPTSEAEIVASLRRQMAGQTTLIAVTHRQALAEVADQVLFVKSGRLVRQGTHQQLMVDSAAYRRLWSKAP